MKMSGELTQLIIHHVSHKNTAYLISSSILYKFIVDSPRLNCIYEVNNNLCICYRWILCNTKHLRDRMILEACYENETNY